MKKLFAVVMLMSGIGLAADVTGSVFTSYTEQGNAAGSPVNVPTTLTQGIALLNKNKPIQYVNVTVQPIWDGGQGFSITGTAVRAWKMSPQRTCAFDGGAGCIQNWDGGYAFAWARYPVLDFAYSTDSGTPYVQNGPGGISFSGPVYGGALVQAAPTFNGGRLYYTIETLSAADGGTMANARILLEGVY